MQLTIPLCAATENTAELAAAEAAAVDPDPSAAALVEVAPDPAAGVVTERSKSLHENGSSDVHR
jgi:hypothetical protein